LKLLLIDFYAFQYSLVSPVNNGAAGSARTPNLTYFAMLNALASSALRAISAAQGNGKPKLRKATSRADRSARVRPA